VIEPTTVPSTPGTCGVLLVGSPIAISKLKTGIFAAFAAVTHGLPDSASTGARMMALYRPLLIAS
jgi:hypothetical protein